MKTEFGKLPDGRTADLYTVRNAAGAEMKVTNYGGIITALKMPDRTGRMADIVLGYDTLERYLKDTPYFGAIIGRYGNRIANGRFDLNGKTYTLAKNNGVNNLHGGEVGFDKVLWGAAPFQDETGTGIVFSYLSKDGEEGFPGNLNCRVVYTLGEDNSVRFDYEATTDQPTVCNLTQHSYFNLAGHDNGDILQHQIQINAEKFTPVNENQIPTGEIRSVEGTPFDFRKMTTIGARIDADNQQLKYGSGYDHNWVFEGGAKEDLKLAAVAYDPSSGRLMETWTTEPGMQFYCGNFLDGSLVGKGGVKYQRRSGFCLETQHFPDSPNQPGFPSPFLQPGEVYKSTTLYKFRVK